MHVLGVGLKCIILRTLDTSSEGSFDTFSVRKYFYIPTLAAKNGRLPSQGMGHLWGRFTILCMGTLESLISYSHYCTTSRSTQMNAARILICAKAGRSLRYLAREEHNSR